MSETNISLLVYKSAERRQNILRHIIYRTITTTRLRQLIIYEQEINVTSTVNFSKI